MQEDELVAQFHRFSTQPKGDGKGKIVKPKKSVCPSPLVLPYRLSFSLCLCQFDAKAFMVSPPTYKNNNKLRTYQVEGLAFLLHNWQLGQGCILADEMGLGKTVQAVTFLDYLYTKENIRGPFLVVAPLSTIGNWQREFDAWTDMNAVVYLGASFHLLF